MNDEELIRCTATEVMGWVWHQEAWVLDSERDADGRLTDCFPDGLDVLHDHFGEYAGQEIFNPLTNPAHWMLVVERMRELGWKGFRLERLCLDTKYGAWFWKEIESDGPVVYAFESLGHAVCEAALKAVG